MRPMFFFRSRDPAPPVAPMLDLPNPSEALSFLFFLGRFLHNNANWRLVSAPVIIGMSTAR
jgi:hypothetical protein